MSIIVGAFPVSKGRSLRASWLCLALVCTHASCLSFAAVAATDPDVNNASATAMPSAAITEESVTRNGRVLHLVHPEGPPKGLVLFFPGSGGWETAVATADEVAGQGLLVVGIDWSKGPATEPPAPCWDFGAQAARLVGWVKRLWSGESEPDTPAACWNLADELNDLAEWTQERENLPSDALPIVMGAGDGSALVYTALLQSPPNRFHAAVSSDFCPRWPSPVPPCPGDELSTAMVEGDRLLPAKQVPAGWFLFADQANAAQSLPPEQACPADQVSAFIQHMANARMVGNAPARSAPAAGEETPSPLASLFQWLDPRIPNQVGMGSADADIAGLPLNEVRAAAEDPATFAVMLSGDGGWAALDRGVSATLASKGISTVGWDSLSYYWTARSPAEATNDLVRVLRHYLDAWHKERVILIGYSFGAEVLPFMADGLPPDLRERVDLVALLGLGPTAMFEFHLNDWLSTGRGADALPVLPEISKLGWTPVLCVQGAEEEDSICPQLTDLGVKVHKVAGDHHFEEDYAGVTGLILDAAATPRLSDPGS